MHFLIASLILLLMLLSAPWVEAASYRFITPVFPIRGPDFFQLKDEKPVDNLKKQWFEVKKRNLSSTWLLRPDGLFDSEVMGFLKTLPSSQEIGLFLEITPTWAKAADVKYRESPNWHYAGSVFLTGYEALERRKLIDFAFEKFKKEFGFYPKSVGAWWIDAGSLSYMREKYGILANMDVADQYSTDNYQVWGQYFSTPFYPAKRNALVPASGEDQKIGVVTIQWATRDPYNSYGNGVLDSTYSVQANDYSDKKYHKLTTDYFKKLLSIYLDNPHPQFGQVTVGLENDFDWNEFGEEFSRQLDVVYQRRQTGTSVLTMQQFVSQYNLLFPQTPAQVIFADDPLGSDGKVVWFQNLRYRVGWFYHRGSSVIRDLRIFQESLDEPCLEKACDSLNLAMTETRNLDEVTFGDRWVIDEGKIGDVKVQPRADGVEINYLNQLGHRRRLTFLLNDLRIDSQSWPVSFAILEALEASKKVEKIDYNFTYVFEDGLLSVLAKQVKNLLFFLLFALFAFFLPGAALLKRTNLSANTKWILAWPVGLAFFMIVAFIFGYLKFRWGILALPFLSFWIIRKNWFWPRFSLTWSNLALVALLIAGSVSWLLTMVKNGLVFDFGMGFWGPHGHDFIWHLSLIEGLKRGLPAENPIFSSQPLQNYHYFYDLLLAEASFWTNISATDLYFRGFPILLSLLIGATTYLLAINWFKSQSTALFSVFFVYFGGSFGWLVSYFKDKSLGGESLFWAQQGISTLINPPFATSLLLFLAGLFLFQKVTSQKQYHVPLLLPLIVLWGTLIEFKAYAGVLALGSLAIITIIELVRGHFGLLKVFLPTVMLALIIFLPTNLASDKLLILSPFWLVHSMVDSPDRLGWFRLSLARISGLETGNYLKFLVAEAVGLTILILGNLGTRMVGLISMMRLWPKAPFERFVAIFLLLSVLLSLLFVQQGGGFNVVQFFYYFILIFNFLAAATLARLLVWRMGWLMVAAVLLLTLPTTWDTLRHYLPARPPARISKLELKALNFLKNQPQGVVLSFNFDPKLYQRFLEPRPLFAYQSTAYVGALSNKPEYIADTVNLELIGTDFKGRLQAQKDVLNLREPEVIKRILKEGKVSFIYAPKIFNFSPDEERFGFKKIFENGEVLIFKVL